jgi:hypothetical protein
MTDDLTITLADLDAHILWAQSAANPERDGFWTPARDLVLAHELCRGRGVDRVAAALGADIAQVRDRWDQLLPRPARTIRLQTELLRLLRRNAAGAAMNGAAMAGGGHGAA